MNHDADLSVVVLHRINLQLILLIACLQESGYSQVSLSVQKDNPALHLYLREGFALLDEHGTEFLMLRSLKKGADETEEVWQ